jgi:Zn-dependent protease
MTLLDVLLQRAVYFIPVLLSLTVHEWAHAWTALRLGDDTAKMQGRVSLNPIDHIDPIGTLLLPLLGIPFGWAKPVPVNPVRFRSNVSMTWGMALTAAAGPISNLLLAVVCGGLLAGLSASRAFLETRGVDDQVYAAFFSILSVMVIVNVLLACFNLLPIPPLDGSRIVDAVMPYRFRSAWSQFTALGPLLLVAVILGPLFLGKNLMSAPVDWTVSALRWLTGG